MRRDHGRSRAARPPARAWSPWAALVLLTSAACYVGGSRAVDPRALDAEQGWLRANEVPVIAQKTADDCGAAALAMVLASHHAVHDQDEIARRYPPHDGGIRAGDLRDYARGAGFASYVISGRRQDLEAQLSHGWPVLVGLAKPLSNGHANLHYEVVAGLRTGGANADAAQPSVLTVDPAAGWRTFSWPDFAREWATTGAVAVLIFPAPQKISPAAK